MKYILNKLSLLALFLAVVTNATGANVLVDNIYYSFSGDRATVTFKEQAKATEEYAGEIVIPSTVTYKGNTYTVSAIGTYAFYKCTLTAITLPNTITTIEKSAFNQCANLKTIKIPNSVTTIRESAFANCTKLNDIYLGENVSSIEKEAFWGCSSLANIECCAKTPPAITASTLQNEVTIVVPSKCGEAYRSDANWSKNIIIEKEEIPMAEYVGFPKKKIFLLLDEKQKLEAQFVPTLSAKQTLLWATDNPDVATVDEEGNVTPHSKGTAIISVTTTDGSNITASVKVIAVKAGIPGDVNGDGEITIADANELVNIYLTE